MRDEIREEVEKQLRERDEARAKRRGKLWVAATAVAILLIAGGSWAQQNVGFGGQHNVSDLFRRFFTWNGADITLANNGTFTISGTGTSATFTANNPNFLYMNGTALRVPGAAAAYGVYADTGGFGTAVASGSNALEVATNGARVDFGAGASDYASSNGAVITFATDVSVTGGISTSGTNTLSGATPLNLTATTAGMFCNNSGANVCLVESNMSAANMTATNAAVRVRSDVTPDADDCIFGVLGGASGASGQVACVTTEGYVRSTTPFTMFSTYINNTIGALTYGGGIAPAHDFQVSAVRFRIRTAGSGGTTDATIRISDGVSNCDCTFACNTAAGNQRIACGTDANCDFEASDSMTVSVAGVGDCGVTTDILGNIEFETLWE